MLSPERLRDYAVRASEASGWDECEDIIRDAVAEALSGPVIAVRVEYECSRNGTPRRLWAEFGCLEDSDISAADAFVRKLGHGHRACCRVIRVAHKVAIDMDVRP